MDAVVDAVKRFVRVVIMGRVTRALSVLLASAQLLIAHWLWVVLAGRELPSPGVCAAIVAAVMLVNLGAIPVIRMRRGDSGIARRLLSVYYDVGVVGILLGAGVAAAWALALPGWLVTEAMGVPPADAWEMFRLASMVLVGGVAALVVWGFTGGQARIRHEHVRAPIDSLHPSLGGLRVLHLSDLHIGNGLQGARLEALVARANAHRADLVCITGDLFDADPTALEAGARSLARLKARLGVYAILGNHDVYVGSDRVALALSEHAPALTLLRKDLVRIPHESPFYIAGFDDPSHILWTERDVEVAELDELARNAPEDGPVLLLIHRPELFGQARRLGFPLVLAGHTHGGQLALPFFERPFNVARIMTRYDRGVFREGGSMLYVNRGLGVAGPALRIGAAREMALVELVAGDRH